MSGTDTPAPAPTDATPARASRAPRLWRLLRRSSLFALVVTALLVAVVWWLLTSIGGRDVLLRRIVAALPAGSSLTWSRAEGPASGPLTLHDVRFTHRACPDRDGQPVAWPGCDTPLLTIFTAKRVTLDPALRPLLDRRLRLDALEIAGATLHLPEDDSPFELPRWPESLPRIAPPLALQADAFEVRGLRIVQGDADASAGNATGSNATDSDAIDSILIDIRHLRGGIDAVPGRLHLERLVADTDRGRFTLHGDYAPDDHYRMDLTASAALPAASGRTPARLGLAARGDLRTLDVALAGQAPAPLRAHLRLRSARDEGAQPRWTLTADSDALSLAALDRPREDADDDIPLVVHLRMAGRGGRATLQGEAGRGETRVKVLPSAIALEEQVLTLSPLSLALFDGTVSARGRADFNAPEDPVFKGELRMQGVRWRGEGPDAIGIVGDGSFQVDGRLAAWTARGQARLARTDAPRKDRPTFAGGRAVVDLDARGNADGARLRTLRATMPGGRLDGSGTLDWSPALGWTFDARLAGFDPGYFAPDWPGAVNGRLRSTGDSRRDGGLDIALAASDLGGRLRGRALGGRGDARLRLPAREDGRIDGDGTVALTLGGSRIDARGRIADVIDADIALAPLRLDDLLPGATGALRGHLQLRGPRARPDIDIALDGDGVRYDSLRAASLQARGRLPWVAGTQAGGRGGDGHLVIDATDAELGLAFTRLHVDARGALSSLRLAADGDSEAGTFALAGDVGNVAGGGGDLWRGTLGALRLAPTTGPAWRLRVPARFAYENARWRVENACFASERGVDDGALCVDADWPRRLDARGHGLPLALLEPYLPDRDDGRAWRLRGLADLDATVRPDGASWRGEATLRSASGGIAIDARQPRELLGYGDLTLTARFDPHRLQATLASALRPDGRVEASIATGWEAHAPLSGTIDIDTRALTWLELFSPDIVEPRGHLAGRIALGGTRAAPTLGGQARLDGFRAELPALAISLRDGDVRLDAQADGSARIVGSVRSGAGTLRVDGTLGWRSDDTPLRLSVRGENVLVADTRELRAVIDPDVVVRYAAGQPIAVSGRIAVPEARLDLERLDAGVSASGDVVVLDPANPERNGSTPLDLDLVLAMGDRVRLHGFGLGGTLGGDVRMRARPGRETTANGALDIDGRYTAYGQKLRITRGRLLWSNSAFSDPVLDVRAEREIGDVTAGIDVTGRASAPVASVWSDPATSESEALAYLTLGRPLASASADEHRQLSAATAALSAGNLLASQLGAKIGLDDAGVSESRALGGTVVGIGKYLSPRIYVGYGVSLLGTGQVITFKYLLRKGFDIQIESSSVENRGSVNWRKEK